MPFSEARFVEIRPYLYHSTCGTNLEAIRHARQLLSATSLMAKAQQPVAETARRPKPELLHSGHEIWLQTQRQLHKGNIALDDGFTFENLLSLLNSKIFFWPGTSSGPIPCGLRHLKGNDWPSAAVLLRVRTQKMLESANSPVEFCAYNSGSPRRVDGRKSPRGPHTFAPARSFERNAGKVVEVVFSQRADLPRTTEVWSKTRGDWTPLFRQ
jgi:hypothetical protein